MALALMELEGAILLAFHEPTSHLDVESIEALEEAIEGLDGTVILVSCATTAHHVSRRPPSRRPPAGSSILADPAASTAPPLRAAGSHLLFE
jgi:hypothetical protein